MSRDWQISIAGTVAFHLALLFGLHVTLTHPARLPSRNSLEVALVAAAAPAAPAVTTPVIQPKLPVIPPPKLPPPEVKPVVPMPLEKVVAQISTAPKPVVVPMLAPPKPAPVGDDSSIKHGTAPTTQFAQPDIRAEPDYLKNPEPPYPLAARRRHQEGLVLVSVTVTTEGKAERVEIKASSGYAVLDEAALQAVRGWEFKPARLGSFAVESTIEVPVRFKLTD